MEKTYDLVIIGAGPAGLAAAIYAKRAMLDFVVLEKWFPGGQIANTYEIENYPGIRKASGAELSDLMYAHATDLGSDIRMEGVESVRLNGDIKEVVSDKDTYLAKTVIIATGASPRKLKIPGEDKFYGRGVSYCAVCDGALYKNKVVTVVGGGDVAAEDSLYLSRMASEVYLVHRRDELRAVKTLQERIFAEPKIETIWNSVITEIIGRETLEAIIIRDKTTGEEKLHKTDGLFVAIGMDPNTEFLSGELDLEDGWIVTDENCETVIPGVFAIGDVRKKALRQVVTGVADGAIAVHFVTKYL
ncbi:MAG TPA: thioredoxin-disulfide reductase [Bacillota bacterium]|nr:thioredoxin-disulfide reductase [Bacillota bacterium]HPF42626.1 thioredoxin-disulfide reductase [Bacillota bacterium]HPJ86210.1 thioredoxin-disulfide reductase [Bacillota bacterium]HPQ62412.1 thioredoxin-disulfide reductase [Bacillota bacterium]